LGSEESTGVCKREQLLRVGGRGGEKRKKKKGDERSLEEYWGKRGRKNSRKTALGTPTRVGPTRGGKGDRKRLK